MPSQRILFSLSVQLSVRLLHTTFYQCYATWRSLYWFTFTSGVIHSYFLIRSTTYILQPHLWLHSLQKFGNPNVFYACTDMPYFISCLIIWYLSLSSRCSLFWNTFLLYRRHIREPGAYITPHMLNTFSFAYRAPQIHIVHHPYIPLFLIISFSLFEPFFQRVRGTFAVCT